MNLPKLSIITVTLNAEATVRRTVESVYSQKYGNLEYIIVDGGSTDRTLSEIDESGCPIDRVISEADSGIYDAMNKGIRAATGDLIGILNADDWYEPGALHRVADRFVKESPTPTVFYGLQRYVSANGSPHFLWSMYPGHLEEDMIPHPTVFVDSRLYAQFGTFDTRYRFAGDYELMLRLQRNGVHFVMLEEIIANFSETGLSVSRYHDSASEMIRVKEKYGIVTSNVSTLLRAKLRVSQFISGFGKPRR